MKNIVCLLEELSAKEMLSIVLPKIVPNNITVKYITFQGKQDLEKGIERKIKFWQEPNTVFLVMRDQDSGDCVEIKRNLFEKLGKTGKKEFSLIRIACHELESFYLGDLLAVEEALQIKNLHKQQGNKKYKEPDRLSNAAQELNKITKNNYEKVAGSKKIAPYLKIDGTNCSNSFNALIDGIKKLISLLDD